MTCLMVLIHHRYLRPIIRFPFFHVLYIFDLLLHYKMLFCYFAILVKVIITRIALLKITNLVILYIR